MTDADGAGQGESPVESGGEPSSERWPIGFMLLVGAVAIYLGWRLVQGIVALIGWLAG